MLRLNVQEAVLYAKSPKRQQPDTVEWTYAPSLSVRSDSKTSTTDPVNGQMGLDLISKQGGNEKPEPQEFTGTDNCNDCVSQE